jgi:hypothetical protein
VDWYLFHFESILKPKAEVRLTNARTEQNQRAEAGAGNLVKRTSSH